jgi:uncharacterized protein involved in exopolysaccharide biosynthesis
MIEPAVTTLGTTYRQTARDIVSIVFYAKRVFVLTFLAVVVGTLAIIVLAPSLYKTSVELVVTPSHLKPLLVDAEAERFSIVSQIDVKDVNTVVFLIKSPQVLREVVIRSGLAKASDEQGVRKAIADLEKHLKTEPMTDSRIVRVTMQGDNPQGIVAQLNQLVDIYLDFHTRLEQVPGREAFFEGESNRARRQYEELSQFAGERMRELRIADPVAQKTNGLDIVRDLEMRKNGLHVDRLAVRAKLNSLGQALQRLQAEGQLVGLPKDVLFEYTALVEMERALAQLVINVRRARNDYLPSSKPVQDAEAQYANMREQIHRYLRQIVADLATQEGSLSQSIADLEAQIVRTHNDVVTTASNGLELDRLMVELGMAKEQYVLYGKKKDEARIRAAKEMSRFINVSVAARPEVPHKPFFPDPMLMVPLSVVIGLMLALAASVLSYFSAQRIRTPTDIRLRTPLTVLGTMDETVVVKR